MSVKSKNEKTCHCRDDALIITKQSASYLISLILLLMFFICIAGYFWGHQQAVQEFSATVEQQSFADQIHYSLSCCADDTSFLYSYNDSAEQEQEPQLQQNTFDLVPTPTTERVQLYSAHLVGFQLKERAYQCMQQIKSKGLDVHVSQRSSKTKGGKLYAWYQVVTEPFASKNDLMDHIATIQQIVKLHDIQIVALTNNEKKI